MSLAAFKTTKQIVFAGNISWFFWTLLFGIRLAMLPQRCDSGAPWLVSLHWFRCLWFGKWMFLLWLFARMDAALRPILVSLSSLPQLLFLVDPVDKSTPEADCCWCPSIETSKLGNIVHSSVPVKEDKQKLVDGNVQSVCMDPCKCCLHHFNASKGGGGQVSQNGLPQCPNQLEKPFQDDKVLTVPVDFTFALLVKLANNRGKDVHLLRNHRNLSHFCLLQIAPN